jgi:hypothetical protein
MCEVLYRQYGWDFRLLRQKCFKQRNLKEIKVKKSSLFKGNVHPFINEKQAIQRILGGLSNIFVVTRM